MLNVGMLLLALTTSYDLVGLDILFLSPLRFLLWEERAWDHTARFAATSIQPLYNTRFYFGYEYSLTGDARVAAKVISESTLP